MSFPFDFGFVPSSLGDDGDPLAVLILLDASTPVGCALSAGLIGVIEASAQGRDMRMTAAAGWYVKNPAFRCLSQLGVGGGAEHRHHQGCRMDQPLPDRRDITQQRATVMAPEQAPCRLTSAAPVMSRTAAIPASSAAT